MRRYIYKGVKLMIKNNAATHLTQEIFQLLKRLPHLRLNVQHIEGLTRSEHGLMVVLRFNITREKTMLSASEITDLLQITPAAGTHLFNPLEKAGYITRTPDPKDRRFSLIGLTEKGQKITDVLLTDVHEQINSLVDYLGEEDTRMFIRLLSKVFDYLSFHQGQQIK
jgi:DNA-binding MarR family transcriptional regulator